VSGGLARHVSAAETDELARIVSVQYGLLKLARRGYCSAASRCGAWTRVDPARTAAAAMLLKGEKKCPGTRVARGIYASLGSLFR
jgi:hypothetical protein